MKRICLHGPESTGKSTLATKLAVHFGCETVPEYGRAYCEEHGTNIDMAALDHIAVVQNEMNQAAAKRALHLDCDYVIFDTDPLITAVWAEMMFGRRSKQLREFDGFADLYLLLDIDLPFVGDGLRVYGHPEERKQFFNLCQTELDNRAVNYAVVRGQADDRLSAALAAIAAAC